MPGASLEPPSGRFISYFKCLFKELNAHAHYITDRNLYIIAPTTKDDSRACSFQRIRGPRQMNIEKVVFAFFIVLALTLNFGFYLGDIDNIDHHNVYELYAAIVVSLIATVMKFGDRTHVGAVLLATSLVADLQLIIAALIWGAVNHIFEGGMTPSLTSSIVSLSAGALLANFTSVILLIVETISLRR